MPEGIVGAETPSAPIDSREKTVSYPQYREGGELVKPIIEHTGILTHDSKIKLKDTQGDKAIQASRRTLALRRVRAELMDVVRKIPKTDTEGRRDLISQGHARDELAEQFMSGQEEVSVEVGDTGKQTARFVVLTPPETRRSEAQDAKPPIFMIPGISNDLESMGMLPQELAFSGRKVVLVGFPESWHGEATDAFGKATEESKTYEPHTTFFKEAISAIEDKQEVRDKIGITSEIDLWGYSTGAAIVAEILATDKQFREQVANAAIICPPNCVDQENFKIFGQEIPLPGAIINELWETVRPGNIKDAAKRNVTNRHDIQSTEDHRKRMLKTYNALREKVLRKNDWWKNDLRVKEGGKITVVSYDKDRLTKSYKVADEIAQNPNLHVIELSGSHNTPLSKPKEAIEAVSA
jgi:pimeloyl-ACP methyl ester carboxylesterase